MFIFHVKFVQTDGQIDRRMYGRTDRRITVKQFALDLLILEHKKKI